MIGFILLIVLTVVLFAGAIVFDKLDNDPASFTCGLFGAFAAVGLLFSIIGLCVAPSDADSFCEQREIRANLVESINDKMATETVNQIISNAIYTNSKIERHRKYVDNSFIGCYYSHKIAECELIPIPKIGVVVNKEE